MKLKNNWKKKKNLNNSLNNDSLEASPEILLYIKYI